MTFRGHAVGGLIAGVGTACLALRWDLLDPKDVWGWPGVLGITFFFSLYPDLDTASVPQRWFYRAVCAILLYLSWRGEYRQATVLAIIAMMPLLDHHRGWTHWRISPVLVIVAPAFALAYWSGAVDGDGAGTSAVAVATGLAAEHGIEIAAAVVGWYTHLLLDGRFKLFPTGRDHY